MVSMILIRIYTGERDATLTFLKSYKGIERVSFFNSSALCGDPIFARFYSLEI